LNKNVYLSFNLKGETTDNKEYWTKLKEEASKDSLFNKETELYGASDDATNPRTMIQASGALHSLSKFH